MRQDLCTRHRERHTARGSHLQRQDPYLQANDRRPTLPSPTAGHREHFDPTFRPLSAGGGTPTSIPRSSTTPLVSPHDAPVLSGHSSLPALTSGLVSHRISHPSVAGGNMIPPHSQISPRDIDYHHVGYLQRSNSDDQYYTQAVSRSYGPKTPTDQITISRYENHLRSGVMDSITPTQPQQYPSNNSHSRTSTLTDSGIWRSSPPYPSSTIPHSSLPQHLVEGQAVGGYVRQQNFPPMVPLPPPVYPTAPPTSISPDRPSFSVAHNQRPIDNHLNTEFNGPNGFDEVPVSSHGGSYASQAFECEADRSPFTLPDDFTTWLFNDPQSAFSNMDGHQQQGPMGLGASAFVDESAHMSNLAQTSYDDIMSGSFEQPVPQHPMSVTSIVDPAQTESILSENKWQQVLDLIELRFTETDHAPVDKQKKGFLQGNREDPRHVLSRSMMQTYIRSYWYHFHPQMPILHKPTFSADKAHNLLLVALIAIGASCLDKLHGRQVTQESAELSSFLAWHLRFEIMKDGDFIAPAELWVFQALVLLEIYEKMYSTRLLHERGVIFHTSTLSLLRRGPSLLGRSALDSTPDGMVESTKSLTKDAHNGPYSHTPDRWWNHWIENEATRRAAFAAFILDSIHATMFGHTVTMAVHEVKMQLPCDESAWSATSSAEVGRIESSLKEKGMKPVSFFDGLKNTLNKKSVRTNSFGRTALMAGLLSVNWHLDQKDRQIRSLGALNALGGKDVWRSTLTKAFDFWKSDFDQSFNSTNLGSASNWYQAPGKLDEENIFESRTVLHHLAHMTTHVDIVSCQIFAGAKRLLGRKTLRSDHQRAQSRIREHWAPRPSARDATFYALKFLAQVLTPDTAGLKRSSSEFGIGGPTAYSARDDFLVNRPWVVYLSALIVWSYGFALDGPIGSPPDVTSADKQTYDMRLFLERVGGVATPGDLCGIPDRNACMGMLHILKAMFENCRWELLREGAKLLSNCINMLQGLEM